MAADIIRSCRLSGDVRSLAMRVWGSQAAFVSIPSVALAAVFVAMLYLVSYYDVDGVEWGAGVHPRRSMG